jgi:SsrA-binding protein
MKKPDDELVVLVRNKKARHDYAIDDSYECGMVLVGSEVKSLRERAGSLLDAYAEIRSNEVWLLNCDIAKYPWANQFNHDPLRPRKLLLHKAEIKKIATKVREKGFTLIPLEIYSKQGKIKIEIALAKGKREYEKRDTQRAREAQREIDRGSSRR